MFCLNDTMRYFLCPGRTDMRKGISSLCGVVHERMKSDVRNGDVFIFIGRSRRLMKLLHAEDGDMVMYVKRVEAGRFNLPYEEVREFKNGKAYVKNNQGKWGKIDTEGKEVVPCTKDRPHGLVLNKESIIL